jgi:hypothetical protein
MVEEAREKSATTQTVSPSVPETRTENPTQRIQIIGLDHKVAEANKVYVLFAWKFSLFNTGEDFTGWARIEFLDAKGFLIDSSLEHVALQRGALRDFTGQTMIRTLQAADVARIQIRLSAS